MKKTYLVFHPKSPSTKILVTRGWFGRLFKPACFATLSECLNQPIK